MKYEFLNVRNKDTLSLKITHKESSITFSVKDILQKNKKDALEHPNQFRVLEAYLDYKGDEFKDTLFNKYRDIQDTIISTIHGSTKEIISHKLLEILYMLDIKDITYFMHEVFGIQAPVDLPDRFDSTTIDDGMYTRVQTYLKSDYYELIALTIPAKIIIGPLGEYALVEQNLVNNMKEYSLFNLIESADNIFQADSSIKLLGLLEKVFSKAGNSDIPSLILLKMIPTSDIPIWLFAVFFLKKMSVADVLKDDSNTNIIKDAYNIANYQLKTKASVDKVIRDKKPSSDGEETESLIESYRMSTDVSLGTIEEFNWVLDRPYDIINQLGLGEHSKVLTDALKFTNILRTSKINEGVIYITSWILNDVLDSRSLWYVDINRVVNAIAIAFTWAWATNNHRIALLLTIVSVEDDSLMISQSVNRTRIPKDVGFDKYYNLNRVIDGKGGTVVKSPVEIAVNNVANLFYKGNYRYCATKLYLKHLDKNVEVPSDLKPLLSYLIMSMNEK